jgi:archaeosine synthase
MYNEKFQYPAVLDSTDPEVMGRRDGKMVIMDTSLDADFAYPDFMGKKDPIRKAGDLRILPNGSELIQRPSRLLKIIHDNFWNEKFGSLLYVQGISDPYLIPVLVYAGISFFDDSYARIESVNMVQYTPLGRMKADHDPTDENIQFLRNIVSVTAASIKSGTLRDLVEKFQVSSKALEILRILDFRYGDETERVFPSRTGSIRANSIESLERPDLVRYRTRLLGDYRPPGEKIALIIPCSARKPYSRSKSHLRLISAIGEFRKYIHEIIVTSPVGLVPRELEEGYPARYYDIPVIGHWYEDEKSMMSTLVSEYFARNHYAGVLAFLPDDLEFLEESLPDGSTFIRGELGNSDDLVELRKKLIEVLDAGRSDGTVKQSNRLQTLESIASYQFGSWIIPKMAGLKRVINYDFELLTENGRVMLVYNPSNGKMTINRNAAPWFLEAKQRIVEIDDFKPTANVYAVGVLSATPDIRQEDEVVLVHGGEVRGVGIAKMPADAMVTLKKGIAVKVRN